MRGNLRAYAVDRNGRRAGSIKTSGRGISECLHFAHPRESKTPHVDSRSVPSVMTVIDENGTGNCSAEGGASHVPLGSRFQPSTQEVLSDGKNGGDDPPPPSPLRVPLSADERRVRQQRLRRLREIFKDECKYPEYAPFQVQKR